MTHFATEVSKYSHNIRLLKYSAKSCSVPKIYDVIMSIRKHKGADAINQKFYKLISDFEFRQLCSREKNQLWFAISEKCVSYKHFPQNLNQLILYKWLLLEQRYLTLAWISCCHTYHAIETLIRDLCWPGYDAWPILPPRPPPQPQESADLTISQSALMPRAEVY